VGCRDRCSGGNYEERQYRAKAHGLTGVEGGALVRHNMIATSGKAPKWYANAGCGYVRER